MAAKRTYRFARTLFTDNAELAAFFGELRDGGLIRCGSYFGQIEVVICATPAREKSAQLPLDDAAVVAEFNIWYSLYPHKVGKRAALREFVKARRRFSLQELCDGRDRYVATKPPDQNWCNPATFLSQDRCVDERAHGDDSPRSAAEQRRVDRDHVAVDGRDRALVELAAAAGLVGGLERERDGAGDGGRGPGVVDVVPGPDGTFAAAGRRAGAGAGD